MSGEGVMRKGVNGIEVLIWKKRCLKLDVSDELHKRMLMVNATKNGKIQ